MTLNATQEAWLKKHGIKYKCEYPWEIFTRRNVSVSQRSHETSWKVAYKAGPTTWYVATYCDKLKDALALLADDEFLANSCRYRGVDHCG